MAKKGETEAELHRLPKLRLKLKICKKQGNASSQNRTPEKNEGRREKNLEVYTESLRGVNKV